MKELLNDKLLSYIGRKTKPYSELVTRRDIRKYAVAVGSRQRKYIDGDQAPPLFHIVLFWEVVGLDGLTFDGLSPDKLLPKFPLERAMAGGSHINYVRDIYPGDWLTATRTLTDIYEKKGRSGPLIFYEIDMKIVNDEGKLVIQEKKTTILR